MNCQECGNDSIKLLETTLLSNGSRRRRYKCRRCKTRWTIWIGDRPQKGQPAGVKRGPLHAKLPRLSDDELRLVLTRLDLSDKAMAQQIGRTREAVRQMRAGITYVDRCPELPRRVKAMEGPTCLNCKHWRGRCAFELPDCVEEGIGFARDCFLYAT